MADGKSSHWHWLIVLLLAVILALNFVDKGDTERETITVSGSAELSTPPDMVDVRLRVEVLAPRPVDAQDLSADRANRVIAAVRALGIADEDIKTEQFNIFEARDWDPRTGEYIDRGWRAVHVLRITTQQLDLAGQLIADGVDAGATGVDSVQFTLSPAGEKQAKAQLLALASDDARAKAEGIAKALGVRLGKPVSVTEQSFFFGPFMAEAAARDAKGVPDIQPGQVDVNGQVTVSFELR